MRDDRRCPSPEELAALAEGRLDGRRQQEVEAHLEGCRDCLEVLAGTARFQLEEESAAGTVARFPARRWPRITAALAAAAALLLAVGILLRQPGARPETPAGPGLSRTLPAPPPPPAAPPARGREAATAEAPAPPSFYVVQLERLAGGPGLPAAGLSDPAAAGMYGFTGTVTGDRLYLRLGARLLDLAVARRAGDTGAAARLEAEFGRLAAAAGLADLPADPAEISRQLPARLPAEAESLCRFGYWAEGGRLAAKFRRPGYYNTEDVRAFGPAVRGAGLPPGAASTMERITGRLEAGVGDDADWGRLERDFTDLVLMF